VNVVWTQRALHDLVDVDEFARRKPSLSNQIANALESACEQIVFFPCSGRVGRVEGTREVVPTGTPFILAYNVEVSEVTILAILHGARLWPKALVCPP
jgi:toxin ParE1/3/4